MREAPEAHDDVAMHLGVARVPRIACRADQPHGERLQRQILRMLERHVEEDAQRHGCRLIVAGGDGALRREARQTIGSEGVRRIPVDVARDLIEQEDQRQGALRRLVPRRPFTPRCNMVSGFKPGAEQGVEAVVALEPLFRPGPGPEGDDVFRADAHGPERAEHDWIIQERFRRPGAASLQNETGYPVRARMDDMKKVSAIALALLLSTAATAYAQQGEDRRGGRDRGGDRGSEQGDGGGARRDRDGEPRGAAAPDSRPGGGRQQQAQPQPQPQYQPPAAAAPQQPAFTPRSGDRGGGGQQGRQPGGGGGGGDRGGRGGGGEWRGGGQPGVAPVTPQTPGRGTYRGGQPNAPQPDAGRGPRGGGDNSGLSGGPGREGGREGGRDWNGGGRGGQGQGQGQGSARGGPNGGQGNWQGGGRGGDNDVNRGGGGRPDGAGRGGDRDGVNRGGDDRGRGGDNRGDWNDRGGGRGGGDSNRWSDNGRSRWNGDRNWDDNNRWRDRNGHTPGYGRNGYRDRDHGRHFYAPNIYRYQYYAQQRYRAGAYRYPSNWFVRSWVFGDYLPRGWYGNSYYLDWNYYGLPYPPIGCEWVRVGRDAVLVDVWTGQVLSVWYSLFW